MALINLTSSYTLNCLTPRATPPSHPRTDSGEGLGEILLKSRPEAPRTAVQHSGFIICSFLQVNRTKLALINLTSNYTLNRPTPRATPPSQPRTDNGAVLGEILLKSRPEALRTAVQHSGLIICSFLQLVNRTKLILINLTSNYTLNRPTPRATPPSQPRTDNGAGLGEILLKSRPEAQRTAVQHSGFIICSFLQVNRTKLALINLTSNYTLNRPNAPGHAPFPDENGQRGRFGRDYAEISPRGTTDGRPTFRPHYLLLPAGKRAKLALINLTNNYTLNRPDVPGHAPFPAENGHWGRFGRGFSKISPRGTTDGRLTFRPHYLLLPAGQQDKVGIDQFNWQLYTQPSRRPGPRPLLGRERTTGKVWARFC